MHLLALAFDPLLWTPDGRRRGDLEATLRQIIMLASTCRLWRQAAALNMQGHQLELLLLHFKGSKRTAALLW